MTRFVKKRNRSNLYAVSLSLLGILMGIGILGSMLGNGYILSLQSLPNNYSLLYVTMPGTLKPPVGEIIDHWFFGNFTVYEVNATRSEARELLQGGPTIISTYTAQSLVASIIPLEYPNPNNYPGWNESDELLTALNYNGMWTGRNVTVAIIDTGVDYLHPDLNTSITLLVSALGRVLTWSPEVNGSWSQALAFESSFYQEYHYYPFMDLNGHGTHVAGIIAMQGVTNPGWHGVAPGAKIIMIKAFHRDGSASASAILTALSYVYNHTNMIQILSCSWGASVPSNGLDPISLAVDAIASRGVWVFVAIGNNGNIPGDVDVPAIASGAMAVGAWDTYNNRLAWFSSIGPASTGLKPDFIGPGVMIVSAADQYVQFPQQYMVGKWLVALSGTSMATPAVAGVAADFIQYWEYWHHSRPTISNFIQYVETNGRRIDYVPDFVTGYGMPLIPS